MGACVLTGRVCTRDALCNAARIPPATVGTWRSTLTIGSGLNLGSRVFAAAAAAATFGRLLAFGHTVARFCGRFPVASCLAALTASVPSRARDPLSRARSPTDRSSFPALSPMVGAPPRRTGAGEAKQKTHAPLLRFTHASQMTTPHVVQIQPHTNAVGLGWNVPTQRDARIFPQNQKRSPAPRLRAATMPRASSSGNQRCWSDPDDWGSPR
jgi:hypothetical protein